MSRVTRACGVVVFIVLFSACAEPPSKEMNQAQGAIDTARAAGAEQYAADEFRAAVDALQRSEQAVAQRDYRLALSLAIDSRERAQRAAKAAGDARARARGEAERVVAEVNMQVKQSRTRFDDPAIGRLPRRVVDEARSALAAAEKDMQEASAALAGDDYPRAVQLAKRASSGVEQAIAALDKPATSATPRKRR